MRSLCIKIAFRQQTYSRPRSPAYGNMSLGSYLSKTWTLNASNVSVVAANVLSPITLPNRSSVCLEGVHKLCGRDLRNRLAASILQLMVAVWSVNDTLGNN